MAAFDEFLRFIYATIARFIPKYTEICVREAEREREREGLEKGRQEREKKRGWWRLCENMQTRATSLEASGAVWITTPPHIIVPSFWKGRGWKLIRRVQSEAKKRVGEKKRKKYRDDIASILGSCVKRDDFFLPLFSFFVQVEERLARDGGDEITTKGKGWRVCFTTSRFQNDTVPQGGLRLRWHCLDVF